MAYRNGNRYQIEMFPQSIEEYVSNDDSVRAFDAFVEKLDFRELGINFNDKKEGNPEYEPRAMIKLFVYGCSYGIRSSRKLERACYHNISFIWLVGGLKPDHKTIAEFRRKNKKALANILKQCAKICLELNLIDGNTLFVDGTKIRANASKDKNLTAEKAKKLLENIDGRIIQILDECERIDEFERNENSHIKLREELVKKNVLKTKIEQAFKKLKENKKTNINMTDEESSNMKSRQGLHAGFNGQIVVDGKNSLIVQSDVVIDNNDVKQFAPQIRAAEKNINKKCETCCGDAGYSNTDVLKELHDDGVKVIVPTIKQASNKEIESFDKENFKYISDGNYYICPTGNKLKYRKFNPKKNHLVYQIFDKKVCLECPNFGNCTKSKNGRNISRLKNEDTKQEIERIYSSTDGQMIYKLRKQKIEHVFGHLKRNLGVNSFLLRGLDGVKAEMSIFATSFNISRMITLLGGAKEFKNKLCLQ
jgi:transposase